MNYILKSKIHFVLLALGLSVHFSCSSQKSEYINRRVEDLLAWTRTAPADNLTQIKDSLEKALNISNESPKHHGLALKEYLIFILKKTGNIELANEIIDEIYSLQQKNDTPQLRSLFHHCRGIFFTHEAANRLKGMKEFRLAIEILDKNNLNPDYNLLNNYAVAEMEALRIEKAIYLFQRAEISIKKAPLPGDENFLILLSINQGVAYIHKEMPDSAYFYFRQAVDFAEESNSADDNFKSLVFLGVYLQETGEYTKSYQILQKAEQLINEVPFNYTDKSLLYEGLAFLNEQRENHKVALLNKDKIIAYRDSIYQSGILEKVFSLDYLDEIKSLKHKKKIDDLNIQIKEQSYRTTIYVIVLILLVILFTSFFITYRLNKRKILNEIMVKNEKLEKEKIKHQAEIELLRSEEQLINANIELSNKDHDLKQLKDGLKLYLDKSFDPEFDGLKKYLNQIKSAENKNDQLKYLDHVLTYSNNEFYKKLKSSFLNLTEDEIRLATLIRMNLTSNEIASVFNISNYSLMTKRYRLRKKLKLNKQDSLDEFIKRI